MLFEYKVIRSNRKTLAIQVTSDCEIIVRAPYGISDDRIDSFLHDKKLWLEKAVTKQMQISKNKKDYSPDDIEALRQKAKKYFPSLVEYYSEIMQLYPTAVKINSAKTRYGSCSGKNSLNFSLYLMGKDPRFIEYVVVHELAHIKHHNHSKAFYELIERYMPDYKERIRLGVHNYE